MGNSMEPRGNEDRQLEGDSVIIKTKLNDALKDIWKDTWNEYLMENVKRMKFFVRDGSNFEKDRAEFKDLLEAL